jgi:hypothetical protein
MRAGDIHDDLLSSCCAIHAAILLSSESEDSRAVATLIGASRLGLPVKLHTIWLDRAQKARIMVRAVSSPRMLRIDAKASTELPAIGARAGDDRAEPAPRLSWPGTAPREAIMAGVTLAGSPFPTPRWPHEPPDRRCSMCRTGLFSAMLLPAVMRFSAPAARYATCARAMGLTDAADDGALLDELDRLNADLSVPTPAVWDIEKAATSRNRCRWPSRRLRRFAREYPQNTRCQGNDRDLSPCFRVTW